VRRASDDLKPVGTDHKPAQRQKSKNAEASADFDHFES